MWKTVKLGEICNVRRGTTITKKNTVDGVVPVIGGGTKPTYFHNEANRDAGCITVSGSGASAGFVNYWDTPIFASDCSTVEIKTDEFLQRFVYYFMQSQQQFIYENFRSGAAQPHVYAKDIATLEIPVITLAEQQRIVAKLDAAFAEIDSILKSSHLKHTEVIGLPTQILKKLLEDEAYEWTSERLSSISDNLDSQRIPITKSQRIEGNIPYYGASGIVDYVKDFIFDDELLLISEDGANLLARTYPIAFSVEGKTWVNNHAHVLKFENKMLQKWVEYYLNSTNIEAFISGMAQPKLNQKKLNEIPIPCPKPNLLPKLLSNLEKIISQSESVFELETQKTKKIEKLKSAILAQELQSEAA